MDITLWIVQALLALAFGLTGFAKLSRNKEQLMEIGINFVEDYPMGAVKGIGALELAAALGLILPMLSHILPILTPLAALGLVGIMIGAAFTHFQRNEYSKIGTNLLLLLLAAFIAYGRFLLVPVA